MTTTTAIRDLYAISRQILELRPDENVEIGALGACHGLVSAAIRGRSKTLDGFIEWLLENLERCRGHQVADALVRLSAEVRNKSLQTELVQPLEHYEAMIISMLRRDEIRRPHHVPPLLQLAARRVLRDLPRDQARVFAEKLSAADLLPPDLFAIRGW